MLTTRNHAQNSAQNPPGPPAPRRWPRCQEAGLGGGRVTSRWQAAAGSGSDQTVAFPADQSGESGKLAWGERTVCAGHVPPVPGRRGGEVMRGAGAGGRGWAEFRWAVAAAAG